MMRMEITFEQRSGALFASLRRDNPRAATPAERAAHDRVWNGLVRFCEAGKIGLSIPAANCSEQCSPAAAGPVPSVASVPSVPSSAPATSAPATSHQRTSH